MWPLRFMYQLDFKIFNTKIIRAREIERIAIRSRAGHFEKAERMYLSDQWRQ